MYEVFFYEDEKGNSEIKQYINHLQEKEDKDSRVKFRKITAYIKKLKKEGLSLKKEYIKHIDGEIWELRPLKDRILFAYYKDNKFILLSCFVKKTRKTPRREILRAKKLLKEYKKRG